MLCFYQHLSPRDIYEVNSSLIAADVLSRQEALHATGAWQSLNGPLKIILVNAQKRISKILSQTLLWLYFTPFTSLHYLYELLNQTLCSLQKCSFRSLHMPCVGCFRLRKTSLDCRWSYAIMATLQVLGLRTLHCKNVAKWTVASVQLLATASPSPNTFTLSSYCPHWVLTSFPSLATTPKSYYPHSPTSYYPKSYYPHYLSTSLATSPLASPITPSPAW